MGDRNEHYRLQRRARLTGRARLLHAHVRPVRDASFKPFGECSLTSTRLPDYLFDFPDGAIVLWSPDVPTFRAFMGKRTVGEPLWQRGPLEEDRPLRKMVRQRQMFVDSWEWEARRSGRTGPRRYREHGGISAWPHRELRDELREAGRTLRCPRYPYCDDSWTDGCEDDWGEC